MATVLASNAILYKPKDIISGDFYFCDEVNDQVFFGTVDCTGHGVPGAMVSIVASHSLNKTIRELGLTEPSEILEKLNTEIPEKLHMGDSDILDGMDMALCKLDRKKNKLYFSGAYQNCWVFNTHENMLNRELSIAHTLADSSDKGMIIELKGNRKGIGMASGKSSFFQIEMDVKKGDKILLSTDGFQDQFGGKKDKKFGVKQMRSIVEKNIDRGPHAILDKLTEALQDWQGNQEQVDDICLMLVEI
jgi:serine phosphatase RsbU (regulator of sigma subunit)